MIFPHDNAFALGESKNDKERVQPKTLESVRGLTMKCAVSKFFLLLLTLSNACLWMAFSSCWGVIFATASISGRCKLRGDWKRNLLLKKRIALSFGERSKEKISSSSTVVHSVCGKQFCDSFVSTPTNLSDQTMTGHLRAIATSKVLEPYSTKLHNSPHSGNTEAHCQLVCVF